MDLKTGHKIMHKLFVKDFGDFAKGSLKGEASRVGKDQFSLAKMPKYLLQKGKIFIWVQSRGDKEGEAGVSQVSFENPSTKIFAFC